MEIKNRLTPEEEELESIIYNAFTASLPWELCDEDPRDFLCDYEEDYEQYREWCLSMLPDED